MGEKLPLNRLGRRPRKGGTKTAGKSCSFAVFPGKRNSRLKRAWEMKGRKAWEVSVGRGAIGGVGELLIKGLQAHFQRRFSTERGVDRRVSEENVKEKMLENDLGGCLGKDSGEGWPFFQKA